MNHPLSPRPAPSLNLISPAGTGILLDYPPKSPDEPPPISATNRLLSSASSSASSSSLRHIPPSALTLHLPAPKLSKPPHVLTQPTRFSHSSTQSSNDRDLLKTFSEECRKMFYTGDPAATKAVEQIIKHLPAGSKAAYTKQMATIRSQFHRDAASSRRAEVDKLLFDTQPSSLIVKAVGNDASLGAMRSPRARQERMDRLKKFISAHCVRNMVGVHPFFSSLCAVLHLMSLPARKGGSGKRRVEWDIDLALFCEAGGEPFLKDSIQFLKGVLGFEDHLKPLVAASLRSSLTGHNPEGDEDEDGVMDVVIGHADGDDGMTLEERQELEVDEELAVAQSEGPFADSSSALVEDTYGQAHASKGKAVLKARDRSLSDPFLDPSPGLASPVSQRVPSHPSPRITVSPAVDEPASPACSARSPPESNASTPKAQPPLPIETNLAFGYQHRRSPTQNSLDAPPPTEIRIFRSPSYLTTPELRELINTFPNFISVRTKSLKFDSSGILDGNGGNGEKNKKKKKKDHQGANYVGHGIIRVSVFEKDGGWKGSMIERIRLLIYRLFKI